MNDQDRLSNIEERLNAIEHRLDPSGSPGHGARGERRSDSHDPVVNPERNRLFWGLVMICVGLIWLGNKLGWFFFDIPILPAALIVLGIGIIFNAGRRN